MRLIRKTGWWVKNTYFYLIRYLSPQYKLYVTSVVLTFTTKTIRNGCFVLKCAPPHNANLCMECHQWGRGLHWIEQWHCLPCTEEKRGHFCHLQLPFKQETLGVETILGYISLPDGEVDDPNSHIVPFEPHWTHKNAKNIKKVTCKRNASPAGWIPRRWSLARRWGPNGGGRLPCIAAVRAACIAEQPDAHTLAFVCFRTTRG